MSTRGRVLLVEDNEASARRLGSILEHQGFDVSFARDGAQALARARIEPPDIVVADVVMPNVDGFDLCWQLRRDPALGAVPVVLATSAFAVDGNREFALAVGADAYIDKATPGIQLAAVLREALAVPHASATPMSKQAFRRRHSEHLLSVSAMETAKLENVAGGLTTVLDETINAIAAAFDLRDTGDELHSWRVSAYANVLGAALGLTLDNGSLSALTRAAMLCDIGNIGVSDHVLSKPGILDDFERGQVRMHPSITGSIVGAVEGLDDAAEIAMAHHERWDGSGYPRGLERERIPLGARVLAVADALDAITSHRPYREARPIDAALQEIARCRESQFDPGVVEAALGIAPTGWEEIREAADRKAVDDRVPPGYL